MFGFNILELLIVGTIFSLPLPIALVIYLVRQYSLRSANPNLAPCIDCGQYISKRAKACPRCGGPV